MSQSTSKKSFKEVLHEIIFEADTPAGKGFDVALLIMIAASVIVVMLESVDTINAQHKQLFFVLEWTFTIFFTAEYVLRIYSVYRPWKYITSFYGVIDLLAILPTYLSLFVVGAPSLMIIRIMRLFRIFRIFKLGHFLKEGAVLASALRASRVKITVFLTFVLLMVSVIGSLMYLVEAGAKSGFDNIPRSVYWAIVTLTTVGYGDISPKTPLGQFLASLVMIIGYAVIAVPTGIVSAEMVSGKHDKPDTTTHNTQACRHCSKEGHDDDAAFCKFCGEALNA